MEKLAMCRICLLENVRMDVVVNKNLHEVYEKLTDIPFVTEDRRPMLACYLCCSKLKQCCRFQRKCLEAEELFARMKNNDYERETLVSPGNLEFFNGFSISPIELFSVADGGQIDIDAIKEELPDVSEGLDDIIDPEEEHQTYKLEFDNGDNSYADLEDRPALHAQSTSEDTPLMRIKTEIEDEEALIGAPIATKTKLETRKPTLRHTISAEQEKNDDNQKLTYVSKMIIKLQNPTSKRTTEFKKPFTKTQHGVGGSVNKTALSTYLPNNRNRDEIKCKSPSKCDDIKKNRRVSVKEKRFKCDICQRSFSKKDSLTRHTRTHTGEKPFKCDVCQSKFSQKNNLVSHIRTHTGEKHFKCDICQRSFSQKRMLVTHTRTHTGEKPFKCDSCQSSFSQKNNLVTHIRTHTGEKHFKCEICQRSFSDKRLLEMHIRTHTGEKPFKCDICQRSFNQKNNLIRHTRTHAGGKHLKCDICQRRFKQKNSLVRHTRTHTGEKPLK